MIDFNWFQWGSALLIAAVALWSLYIALVEKR